MYYLWLKQKIWLDFDQKLLENWLLGHIAQYLKITWLPISRARNVLEGPNLDQWYLSIVSRGFQRDFWKFPFFPIFWGAAGEKMVKFGWLPLINWGINSILGSNKFFNRSNNDCIKNVTLSIENSKYVWLICLIIDILAFYTQTWKLTENEITTQKHIFDLFWGD